jgi:hypothetical protein
VYTSPKKIPVLITSTAFAAEAEGESSNSSRAHSPSFVSAAAAE